MNFDCKLENGICWITVQGRLDGETAETFDSHLQKLTHQGHIHFAIDFSKLTFLNSRGLSSLIHLSQTVGKKGGKVVVVGLQGPVREVFEAVQLESLIASVPSIVEARRIFIPDTG